MHITGIASDVDGQLIVAAEQEGKYSDYPRDVVLSQILQTGERGWQRVLGGPGRDSRPFVVIDKSAGIVMVVTANDSTPSMENEGPHDYGGQPIDLAERSSEIVLARYDGLGRNAWSKSLGSRDYENASGVAMSGDRIIVLGDFGSDGGGWEADFGGGPLRREAGHDKSSGVFVIALDADGNHEWSRLIDVSHSLFDAVMDVAPDGTIVVVADTRGLSSGALLFLALSPDDGSILWREYLAPRCRPHPGWTICDLHGVPNGCIVLAEECGSADVFDVAALDAETLVVTGRFHGEFYDYDVDEPVDGDPYAIVYRRGGRAAALTAQSNSDRLDGPYGVAVARTGPDEVVIAGTFKGQFVIGDNRAQTSSKNDRDIFIVRVTLLPDEE